MPPLTLLAFGDSLTAGYGLPPDAAPPALLQAMLDADGYAVQVVNAGVSGETTAGGLARLPWLLEDAPDAAILELGANDGLRGVDPAEMESNLMKMLELFKANDVEVLFTGMRAMANLGEEYVNEYEAVFTRLSQQYDVLYYPFYLQGVAGDPALNQPDGIHPNEAGAKVIAERIYPYVKQLVERVRERGEAG